MRIAVASVAEGGAGARELVPLFASVALMGGRLAAARRVAFVVGDVPPDLAAALAALDVEVRVAAVVEPRFRLANKLTMLAELAGEADVLVGLDPDTVVTGDPTGHLAPDLVQAKQPDGDLLTLDDWAELFARVGLTLPAHRLRTSLEPGWTHAYFNTGVLMLPGAALARLHDRWLHYIRVLIDDEAVASGIGARLADRVPHPPGATEPGREGLYFAEQWAFAMARHDLALPYAVLPLALNFPVITRDDQRPGAYIDERLTPEAVTPLVIHHHHRLEGGIPSTGYRRPDEVIARANRVLAPHLAAAASP